MLKKRIFFTLLFSNNNFYLSRNFNLQKIGNLQWIIKNYAFKKISNYIDELVILDVGFKKNPNKLTEILAKLSKFCSIPISVGGGITDEKIAVKFIQNGADKIVINSLFSENISKVRKISKIIGGQAIVASVDCLRQKQQHIVKYGNGKLTNNLEVTKFIKKIDKEEFGELMINSIDQDGTGQGFDFNLIKKVINTSKPVIVTGGAGKLLHFKQALNVKNVSAVNTSNLLNFLGDSLKNIRKSLIKSKYDLPEWDTN